MSPTCRYKTKEDKVLFNELLLYQITVMNRAIWSDPETSNTTKLDCLKWSNELAHRVWSLLFELKKGIDERSENALAEQIDFYRKQSDELAGHLAAALRSTVAQLNRLSLDTL